MFLVKSKITLSVTSLSTQADGKTLYTCEFVSLCFINTFYSVTCTGYMTKRLQQQQL